MSFNLKYLNTINSTIISDTKTTVVKYIDDSNNISVIKSDYNVLPLSLQALTQKTKIPFVELSVVTKLYLTESDNTFFVKVTAISHRHDGSYYKMNFEPNTMASYFELDTFKYKTKVSDAEKINLCNKFLVMIENVLLFFSKHNLVYSDWKFDNILIGAEGNLKICDFGGVYIENQEVVNKMNVNQLFCAAPFSYLNKRLTAHKNYDYKSICYLWCVLNNIYLPWLHIKTPDNFTVLEGELLRGITLIYILKTTEEWNYITSDKFITKPYGPWVKYMNILV